MVAEALGAERPSQPRFEFLDRLEDRQAVETMLAEAGWQFLYRGLRSTPPRAGETKRWPPRHFAEAADQLSQALALPIVFIGGAAERQEIQAVMALMRMKAVDLTGQTPVGLLPCLLRQAAVLITNDSGPMHIAAAVGTPAAAFCPARLIRAEQDPMARGTSSSPIWWNAVPASAGIVSGGAARMSAGVTPDQVVRAVQQQLARSPK